MRDGSSRECPVSNAKQQMGGYDASLAAPLHFTSSPARAPSSARPAPLPQAGAQVRPTRRQRAAARVQQPLTRYQYSRHAPHPHDMPPRCFLPPPRTPSPPPPARRPPCPLHSPCTPPRCFPHPAPPPPCTSRRPARARARRWQLQQKQKQKQQQITHEQQQQAAINVALQRGWAGPCVAITTDLACERTCEVICGNAYCGWSSGTLATEASAVAPCPHVTWKCHHRQGCGL